MKSERIYNVGKDFIFENGGIDQRYNFQNGQSFIKTVRLAQIFQQT